MADQQYLSNLETIYGLPSGILNGVMQVESGGNVNAVSPVGAQGPFQLMPPTAKQYGVSNPFDPVQSADGAARFLSDMIKQTGSVTGGLEAYNWGIGNMNSGKSVPQSVKDYASNVLSYLNNSQEQPIWTDSAPGISVTAYGDAPPPQANGTIGDSTKAEGFLNVLGFGLTNIAIVIIGIILLALVIWSTLSQNKIEIVQK